MSETKERNDRITQEIINNPSLVRELCALTGDLTLAFAHSRIHSLQIELRDMMKLIGDVRRESKALRSEVEDLRRKSKKLQDMLLGRIRELEGKIGSNGRGPEKSD